MDFVAARNDSRKRSLSELNGKLYNSKDLSNRETKTLLHFVFNHTKLVLPLDREGNILVNLVHTERPEFTYTFDEMRN